MIAVRILRLVVSGNRYMLWDSSPAFPWKDNADKHRDRDYYFKNLNFQLNVPIRL